MQHYINAATTASLKQEIKAHLAHLAELRAQRPFRHVARRSNVVSIAAARRVEAFPLVGLAGRQS